MASTNSVQVGFIDLSAFSEIDAYLYGGQLSVTWFVGTVQKSNWFTIIPVSLRHDSTPNFGTKASALLNRTGDYAINTWFRVQIPQIVLIDDPNIYTGATLRWTRYLGHALFKKIQLTHNELVTQEFTSEWMDMNFQFNICANKRIGYRQMICDIPSYYNAQKPGVPVGDGGFLNIPLPLWYTEDSGRALPVAGIPFCETKINYDFRDWSELVVVFPGIQGVKGNRIATVNDVFQYSTQSAPTVKPAFINPETFTTFAMVHNDEREMMGNGNRDILMYQIQIAPITTISGLDKNTVQTFDIRFSNPIVALFFAIKNISINSFSPSSGQEHANYTTEMAYTGMDPIGTATLLYENSIRTQMGADYYSLVAPYYHTKTIPDEYGYHMYPYALDAFNLNPCGSTNYNKLANVSLQFNMSSNAKNSFNSSSTPVDQNGYPLQWPDQTGTLRPIPQSGQSIIIGKNHQLARIGNGTFGFPVL